jgi:hypothetical protein
MLEEMRHRAPRLMVWLLVLLLLPMACSTTPKATDGSQAREKNDKEAPLYYDFGDVLVPRELKLDTKSSFVYRTTGLTAGVLVFNSRADLTSLVAFFENNMSKDNWQAVGIFKSPRTLLLYRKENRWCVINVTDGSYSSLIEIWVAPFSDVSGSGLLK